MISSNCAINPDDPRCKIENKLEKYQKTTDVLNIKRTKKVLKDMNSIDDDVQNQIVTVKKKSKSPIDDLVKSKARGLQKKSPAEYETIKTKSDISDLSAGKQSVLREAKNYLQDLIVDNRYVKKIIGEDKLIKDDPIVSKMAKLIEATYAHSYRKQLKNISDPLSISGEERFMNAIDEFKDYQLIDEFSDRNNLVLKKDDEILVGMKGSEFEGLTDIDIIKNDPERFVAGIDDWLNVNLRTAFGFNRSTKRYKDGVKLVEDLLKKYPESNIKLAGHSLSGGIVNHISESLPEEKRLIETHMFQPAINPFIKKLKSLKVPRKNTIYRLKGDVVSMMSKLFYNKNTDDYIIKEIAPKVGTESNIALLHDYKQFYNTENKDSTLRSGRGRTSIGLARIASNILEAGLFALTVDDAYNMATNKVDSKEYNNQISEDLNPFILLNLNLDPEYEYTPENVPDELNQTVKYLTGQDLKKQAQFERITAADNKNEIGKTYDIKDDGQMYTKSGVKYVEYKEQNNKVKRTAFQSLKKDAQYAYDLFDVIANYQIQNEPIGMVSKRSKNVM
jgi:hypothetical protein